MLGYVESLQAQGNGTLKLCLDESDRKFSALETHVRMLSEIVQEKNRLLLLSGDELQARERLDNGNRETLVTNELLKSEISSLRSECTQLQDRLLAESNYHEESRLEMELYSWIEIESKNLPLI